MLQQVWLLPAEVSDCWRIIWFISSFSLFSKAFSFSSSSTLWHKHSKEHTMRHSGLFFFSSNDLFSLLTYSSHTTSLIYQNLNLNLFFYPVFILSPFPDPFSQSCAPSPTASFELMPPVAVPSASPAHPVGRSVDLRPGDSGRRPAASGAFSPLSPKCYSLAAAAHSEPWSLCSKHKCQ